MAIVGWSSWKNANLAHARVRKWSLKNHFLNSLLSGFLALLIGFIFQKYTNQANPYVDAFTTCYSLSATYMVTRKILGNWVYWIVIDLISIYLYAERAYYLTAVQYAIFTLLAVYGLRAWQKQYKLQVSC
jgi:nicotinamide mononucleotide transporter